MATGTITWVDPARDHAFIAPDGGGDVFVRSSEIAGAPATLVEGAAVEFDLQSSRKGRLAVTNVVVTERL
jgi:cold shock CspA family protein